MAPERCRSWLLFFYNAVPKTTKADLKMAALKSEVEEYSGNHSHLRLFEISDGVFVNTDKTIQNGVAMLSSRSQGKLYTIVQARHHVAATLQNGENLKCQ